MHQTEHSATNIFNWKRIGITSVADFKQDAELSEQMCKYREKHISTAAFFLTIKTKSCQTTDAAIFLSGCDNWNGSQKLAKRQV